MKQIKKYTKSKNSTFRIFFTPSYTFRQTLQKNCDKIHKTKEKSLNYQRWKSNKELGKKWIYHKIN